MLQGYVLDASAVLALLNQETGADKVEQALLLPATCMSSVQLAEVIAKLVMAGIPTVKIQEIMTELAIPIVDLNEKIAFESALLMPLTKPLGLSLGDRVCLATSLSIGLPALTADKVWLKINIPIAVEVIR
jgi:PIN domain nuclease of toxin-antitoxin system